MARLTLRRRLSDWLGGANRPSRLSYEATDAPDENAVKAVERGLQAYNAQYIGEHAGHLPLAVFVRDSTGRVRGGATGYIGWAWLYVERLWVDEALRGRGVGSKLLLDIEREALDRGVFRFQLGTASFQAREFYEKNGYEVFAELPDHPPGHVDYFMKKIVDLSGGE